MTPRNEWNLPIQLDKDKKLIGLHLALQAWFLHPSQGVALTNGLYLILGR